MRLNVKGSALLRKRTRCRIALQLVGEGFARPKAQRCCSRFFSAYRSNGRRQKTSVSASETIGRVSGGRNGALAFSDRGMPRYLGDGGKHPTDPLVAAGWLWTQQWVLRLRFCLWRTPPHDPAKDPLHFFSKPLTHNSGKP